MYRYLVLVTLIGCLGIVSAVDFRAGQIPPCPEFCHDNCRTALAECIHECNEDEDCIHKCGTPFNNCINYCNWVCGPE
jgi:hypothetical protein